MYENSLNQFISINQILRKKVYSIQMPEAIILDLDSTFLNAYGKQEGRAFNFHYLTMAYSAYSTSKTSKPIFIALSTSLMI